MAQATSAGGRLHNVLGNRNIAGQHTSESAGVLSSYSINPNDIGTSWTDLGVIATGGAILRGASSLGNGVAIIGDANGIVYRSSDYGQTWSQTQNFGFILFTSSNLGNGRSVIAGDNFRTQRANDYGLYLTVIVGNTILPNTIFASAYLGNDIFLVGDTGGRIWRSTNGGQSYVNIGVISGGFVDSITYLDNGIVIFTDNQGHIYRSTDYGTAGSWTDIGDFTTSSMLGSVYLGNGVVLASDGLGHIFRSIDSGLSWTDLGVQSNGGSAIQALSYLGNGIAIFGDFNGHVFKSIDNGLTWTDIGPGGVAISGTVIRTIAYLGNGTIVLGDNNGHVFRSEIALKIEEAKATIHSDLVLRDITGQNSHRSDAVGTLSPYAMNPSDIGSNFRSLGIITTAVIGGQSLISLGNGIAVFGDANRHIFRSIDHGATWTDLGTISTVGFSSGVYIGDGIAIFGDAGNIYRSTDFGFSWTFQTNISGFPINVFTYAGSSTALGQNIIIAGDNNGHIFTSINAGLTWVDQGDITGVNSPIISLAYLDNGIVLAGDNIGHIRRNTTFGLGGVIAWTDIGDLGFRTYGLTYLGNGVVIVAGGGVSGDVYRSTDFGLNWTSVATLTIFILIRSAYFGNGVAIFTGTDGHVYRSIDYGLSWTDLGLLSATTIGGIAYLGDGVVILSDGGGIIYRSNTSFKIGEARATVHNDLLDRNLVGISAHRSELVGTLSPYALKGFNIARRWSDLGDVTGLSNTSSLYIGSGITLLGTTTGTIYISKDHGTTWIAHTAPSAFRVNSMAYTGDGIIITGDANGQVFQSSLYAQDTPFALRLSVGAFRAMVVSYFGDGICIAGDSIGNIYRSTNFGAFWAGIAGNPQTGNSINQIIHIEGAVGIFVDGVGFNGRIFRTTDRGLTWTQQLNTSSPFLSCVYIGNGIVLAGQSDGHVWRSTDSGATWTDLGVIISSARTLTYLGNNLVMITSSGANPGHVYLSYDLGISWNDFLGDITGVGSALATASYIGNGVAIIGDNAGHIYRSDVAFKTDEAVHDIPGRIISTPVDLGVSNNHFVDIVDASGANRTMSLLSASGARGRVFHFKKIDATANTVTIVPGVGDTIDGNAAGYVLTVQYQSVTIISDGTTNWWII